MAVVGSALFLAREWVSSCAEREILNHFFSFAIPFPWDLLHGEETVSPPVEGQCVGGKGEGVAQSTVN